MKTSKPTQKMSVVAVKRRWHTPAPPAPEKEYVKSLYDILDATVPVYQQTREASNVYPFSVIFSRAEKSLPFVVRRKRWVPEGELERLHYQSRYRDMYGAPVPKDICVIVARLLTPSEVLDLHDGDPSFFLYTERSGSPVAVDAAGLVFDEGRWDLQLLPSGKLDPAHHYGEERSTERHMCCGEPHGLTEGCWSEKVVQPYQLWYDVAPNFWTEDGPLVTPQYIVDNIATGTLWKRTDPTLDADIRDKLARIAIPLSQAYARLTEQLDQRAFDPTISIQLSPHDDLRRLVGLVHAFNEPQQPNARDPSAYNADWRTHLWERVFRVPDALRLFTQETRAFIVDPATNERVKLRIFKAGDQIPAEYAAVVFASVPEIAQALQDVMNALAELKLSIDGYHKARDKLGENLFQAIFGPEYNALAQSARDVAWTQLRAVQMEMNRRIKNSGASEGLWDVLEPLQLAERAIPQHLTEQTIDELTQMVLAGQVPPVEPYRTRFLDRSRPAQQIRDVIQNAIDVIENGSSDVSAAELLWSLETLRPQEWKDYLSDVVQALSSIDNQAAAVPILRTLADQGFSQDIIKRLAALIPPKKPAPPKSSLKAAPVTPTAAPSVGGFSTKHFLFKSNSCPFDATLSALFKVADAPPTQWVRGAKNLVLPAGCNANAFQAALLSDVDYLQSPPGSGPLRTNAFRERFKACFPNVFNADNSGDAVDLLRQLLVIYGAEDKTQGFPIRADKENGVIEFPIEFDAVGNFAPDVLFYDLTIISLLDAQMQGIQNLDEVFTPRDFGRFPVRGAELRKNFFGTEYELMSCIAFAGGFHYVSYVRDPTTGTWYFFDADGAGTPGQPLQGALPERVTRGTPLMQPKIWIYRKLPQAPKPQAPKPQAPKPQAQEPFQEWWIKRRDAEYNRQRDAFLKDAEGLPDFPLYRRQLASLLSSANSPSEIRHWALSMLYNSGLRQNDAEMNAFRVAIEPYAMRLGLVKNGTLSSIPADIWNDARRRNIYLYAIEKLFDMYDLRGGEADLQRALDALNAVPPPPPSNAQPQAPPPKRGARSDNFKGSAAFPLYRKGIQDVFEDASAIRIYAPILDEIFLQRKFQNLRKKYEKTYAQPLGLRVRSTDDLVYFEPSELLWNEGDRLLKNAYLFGVEALLDALEGIEPVREDDMRHGLMASQVADVVATDDSSSSSASDGLLNAADKFLNRPGFSKQQQQEPEESSDWD